MGKILKTSRDGDLFLLKVELESGHKEEWTYTREETSTGASWTMIAREDVRK